MRLPDSVVLGTTVSIALSHCGKDNLTEGILLCSSDADLRKIAETVLRARSLAAHPAALPVVICGLLADVLDYKIETAWAATYRLETDGGQSGLLLKGNASLASQNREQDLALNQRSIALAQLALAWETYTQTLADLTQLVDQFLRCKATSQWSAIGTESAEALVRGEQQLGLQNQVDYLSQRAAGLVQRGHYLRARLELQNTAVIPTSILAVRPGMCFVRPLLTNPCGNRSTISSPYGLPKRPRASP
jgi:hypothetical protein